MGLDGVGTGWGWVVQGRVGQGCRWVEAWVGLVLGWGWDGVGLGRVSQERAEMRRDWDGAGCDRVGQGWTGWSGFG